MTLQVCGVLRAAELLTPDHRIDVVISILDPLAQDYLRPRNLDSVAHVLELQFHDVEYETTEYVYPTMEDAQEIVDFMMSTLAKPNTNNWLIHCHQGISRSTACGLLWCALNYGLNRAQVELLTIAPHAVPNVLMCQHFDQILGWGGKFATLAWDFDYQALKQLARGYIG